MPFEFDFTDVSPAGFITLPPGRYPVETGERWMMRKNEKGNYIIEVDLKVTAGEYKGQTPRYFHVIVADNESTKSFLYRFLSNTGVVQEGDRGPNGELKFSFNFGEKETDDSGVERVAITSANVNGEQRRLTGLSGTAVVVKNDQTKSGVSIDRIDPPEGPNAGAGNQAPAANTHGQGQPKRNDIPF